MNLLALMPWPYRWAAVLALAAVVAVGSYVYGYQTRDDEADRFEGGVQALADDAARRAGETKATQDRTTKEIRDAHQIDVRGIHAYYARRLRDAQASRRVVSAAADGAGRADGAASQCAPGDEGDESDIAMIELEERAALDAAKLLRWQDFARRNGFPVE